LLLHARVELILDAGVTSPDFGQGTFCGDQGLAQFFAVLAFLLDPGPHFRNSIYNFIQLTGGTFDLLFQFNAVAGDEFEPLG
jgi:hypothetical protein